VMNNKKITFGIVGGIGPLAGADIFFKFVKSTPAYDDSDHFNILLEQHPLNEKQRYTNLDYDPSTRKLHIFNIIQKLVEQKANCIILTCFISHNFIDEIAKEISVPIINMMDGLRHHMQTHYSDVSKIGVLTSDYSKSHGLFEKSFDSEKYEIIYPDQEVQEQFLMESIYGPNGIKAGNLTGTVIEDLEKVCDNLLEKGVEVIIPGFTEIPVVYDALKKKKNYIILDSNQIYANYTIQFYQKTWVKQQYRIGIIGGLGPSATVDLMDKIIKNTPGSKDQEHIKMLVEHNPQIPDRTAFLTGNGDDPTIPLYSAAKRLEKRDADFIVIPCNTAHAFVEKIQHHLLIPIVNMIEETVSFIKSNFPSCNKVGLLATSGTVSSKIYHQVFEKTDIQLLIPNEENQYFVMESIYGSEGAKAGFTTGKCYEQLYKASEYLVSQGAEVLILGCTELPLIFEENMAFSIAGKAVAILDPTNILAKKCVSLIEMLDHQG